MNDREKDKNLRQKYEVDPGSQDHRACQRPQPAVLIPSAEIDKTHHQHKAPCEKESHAY